MPGTGTMLDVGIMSGSRRVVDEARELPLGRQTGGELRFFGRVGTGGGGCGFKYGASTLVLPATQR